MSLSKIYNAKTISLIYLEGIKVRRTIWPKGQYVQLRKNGKYSSIQEINIEELQSPISSIEKFGFDENKKWEIL